MKLIKKEKKVNYFILYRGKEVLDYGDKVVMGDQVFDSSYYYYEMGGVLARRDFDENCQLYKNGVFEDAKFRYHLGAYFAPEVFSSYEEADGFAKFSFVETEKNIFLK